jgi:hypothetical protein
LISIPILFTTVRALPGDAVAGHSPLIFIHAGLAHGKSTPALPAEHKCPHAAVAGFLTSSSPFSLAGFFMVAGFEIHYNNILLLYLKR